MLIIWMKVYSGDPNACQANSSTVTHSCPCVNDGSFLKAIEDPFAAPESASYVFKLLTKPGLNSSDTKPLLEALLGLEFSVSMVDVSEAFSMIDTHRKGYLTEQDLELVFGPRLHGQTMRELIAESHRSGDTSHGDAGDTLDDTMCGDTISGATIGDSITYKELQQHLQSASEMP